MSLVKVLVCFGTRPEFIKLAPLIDELRNTSELEVIVCSTGQHDSMLSNLYDSFCIRPDYDLSLLKKNHPSDLNHLLALIIHHVSLLIRQVKPSLVVVHGDTTSCLGAALASFHCNVEVAHVEAGLRTMNKREPFPEEVNRTLVAKIADMHFAPTKKAYDRLVAEGVDAKDIWMTGNTVIDSVARLVCGTEIQKSVNVRRLESLREKFGIDIACDKFVIVTVHRRENLGLNMIEIFRAVKFLAANFLDLKFLFPVHKNPQIRELARSYLADVENIYLVEPIDYLEFIYLLSKCLFVITDSGGIQEEAAFLGKPVLITRESTERSEGLCSSNFFITGADRAVIVDVASELLGDQKFLVRHSSPSYIFGDGRASKRIAKEIKERFVK